MITINNYEELDKYYNNNIDTYVFNDDVTFSIDVDINATIMAHDIYARNINAYNIKACNINAYDINACNINAYNIKAWNVKARDIIAWNVEARNIFYTHICTAIERLKCDNMVGAYPYSIHKCLQNEIEYIEEKTRKEMLIDKLKSLNLSLNDMDEILTLIDKIKEDTNE